ncbi:MAG TPA: hypothetical protein VNQ81_12490 [Povalibacter sp.]|nr:hypothetical protein [Povalibacter sp.]
MPDRNKDVAQQLLPGARAPVLNSALLTRVHALNRDYVDLLLAEHRAAATSSVIETLPVKVLAALEGLSREALALLTATPFALWSLRFDDLQSWGRILDSPLGPATLGERSGTPLEVRHRAQPDEPFEARYGRQVVMPMRTAFCEIALFFVWHTVASNRVAARVLFAVPDNVAAMLIRVPLWRLKRISIDFPGLLMPRWPNNPAFWPDLARFAAAGDHSRLTTTRLLGTQLLASELDGTLPLALRRQSRMRLR